MKSTVARWLVRVAIGAFVVAGSVAQISSVSAQTATPITGPVVPDPAECTTEARTLENIVALFTDATPFAEPASRTSVEVPIGETADAATSGAVNAALRQAVACLNAGDFGRFLGHLTDETVRVQFGWIGEELKNGSLSSEFTNPTAVPAEFRQTILSVSTISLLEDGRALAIVALLDPNSEVDGPEVLGLIFVLEGGRWLIDELIDLNPN